MNTVSKCPIFTTFLPIFHENKSKWVQKFCSTELDYFFESKNGKSNEHGVTMSNFPSIYTNFL